MHTKLCPISDETMPIINKSNHPKKQGNTRKKKKGPHPKRQKKSTNRGETTSKHQVPKPLLIVKNIYQTMKGEDPLKRYLV
jgi:hypothetical protein